MSSFKLDIGNNSGLHNFMVLLHEDKEYYNIGYVVDVTSFFTKCSVKYDGN